MKEDYIVDIQNMLFKLGICPNSRGYHYILQAVKIIRNQTIRINITTIYEMIYINTNESTSPSAIERCIRYCIQKSYRNNLLTKKIYKKNPTNSEFLYDLVFNFDILKQECETL